ncbi:DUF2085 domain-containing protein [Halorussus salinisoli]|uniref:DUF2085 domain-containing protein n=1 Tax=Halorussus salinisoli TaxID=2558242 RepID=UPI0010C21EAF|nr:DUF2085 domain-containing protein [Halorussus salinisoli]
MTGEERDGDVWTTRWREFRQGLGETRRYALSHHEPGDWDRCFAVSVPWRNRERPVQVCARCAGIYPGIAFGVLACVLGLLPRESIPVLVGVLPVFALADWSRTAYTHRTGHNLSRATTGLSLGIGYGCGLVGLTQQSLRPVVVAVGVVYAGIACVALVAEKIRSEND